MMSVESRVRNDRWSALPAGVPASLYAEEAGAFVRVGRVVTTRALLPGESELLPIDYPLGARDRSEIVRFRFVINDAGDAPPPELIERRPRNDNAEAEASCSILF